jgi:hypothetical protein
MHEARLDGPADGRVVRAQAFDDRWGDVLGRALDRIVACATPPGGLVVDLFSGSGTTGESAHALGRRFVLGDRSPIALSTARARLLRAAVPLAVQSCGSLRAPAGKAPRLHLERDGPTLRIALREPREPLAWAVGALEERKGRGPCALWHSERAPGRRRVRPIASRSCRRRARGTAGRSSRASGTTMGVSDKRGWTAR